MHFSSVLFRCYLDDFGFDAVIYNDLFFGRFSKCRCARSSTLSPNIYYSLPFNTKVISFLFYRIFRSSLYECVLFLKFQIQFLIHFFLFPLFFFASTSSFVLYTYTSFSILFILFIFLIAAIYTSVDEGVCARVNVGTRVCLDFQYGL